MTRSFYQEFRCLLPISFCVVVATLPAIIFWNPNVSDVPWPSFLFFIACTALVAFAFRPNAILELKGTENLKQIWRLRMLAITAALFLAFIIFSALCFFLNDKRDAWAIFLTSLILIPTICITPYFAVLSRNSLAAVIFTLFLVFCMKLLGCIVVVIVYGWHADIHGHTTLPWTHPNLLVWLCWINTGVLSAAFYFLGKRRFMREVHLLSNPISPGSHDSIKADGSK